jgi:hypothetical protein
MSQPLRFKPVNPAHEMIYSPDGGWVSWEDYARLKADVNELADGLKLASEVGIKMADEVTRLKAEVERLSKAGDAMLAEWKKTQAGHYSLDEAEPAWLAAKENPPHA